MGRAPEGFNPLPSLGTDKGGKSSKIPSLPTQQIQTKFFLKVPVFDLLLQPFLHKFPACKGPILPKLLFPAEDCQPEPLHKGGGSHLVTSLAQTLDRIFSACNDENLSPHGDCILPGYTTGREEESATGKVGVYVAGTR